MLTAGKYNDLALFIERVEQEGKVTPALLQLRGLPQALQALRLFCARRPFVNSRDLEQALNFLRPYAPELASHSSFFQDFMNAQQQELAEMRSREISRKVEEMLRELDWTLACRSTFKHYPVLLRKLAETAPDSPLFRYVRLPGGTAGPALNRWLDGGDGFANAEAPPQWLELALAVTWSSLTPERQQLAAEALKKNPQMVTLTGTAAQAGFLNSASHFERAIAMWAERASAQTMTKDAPAFAEAYLNLAMPAAKSAVSPVIPGVTEYSAIFGGTK
jgi:hypothetical protein